MNANLSQIAALVATLAVVRTNVNVVRFANTVKPSEANRRLTVTVADETLVSLDDLLTGLRSEIDRFEAAADEVPLPELEPIFKTAHVYELREQAAYAERATDDDERASYADVA